MTTEWNSAVEALSQITVKANSNNEPVTILGSSNELRCVGVGTDAAVFSYTPIPKFAFKIYADEKLWKKDVEEEVYHQLGESRFFPKLYGTGDRYLVLSFEEGITLYDCILQGVHIPKQVVEDVEAARQYIRERGLNPRDIHLKNILLQDGGAKILDVSEYIKPGNDYRWEHLKQGYESFYHLIDGKALPYWLLETTRKWYNQSRRQSLPFEEFIKKLTKLKL